jgi:predicted Zn-dependent protease
MKKLLILLLISGCFFLQPAYTSGQSQGRGNQAPGGNNAPNFFDNAFSSMERAFTEAEEGITPQDAYFLGRAVAAHILAIYKPYTANPELTQYLNKICQTILINSSQLEVFNGCQVQILDSPEYNAFASPGGHIFITRRLVESTSSEDMLAAVIAHELAHIMLKHGISIVTEMRLNEEMAQMANRAADFAGRDSQSTQRLLSFRNSVSIVIDTMLKNGYSQVHEFEADQEALALLARAGYDPGALLEILKVLQVTQNSQPGGFNTTHPSPADRIANAERWIRSYRVQDTRSYRVPRFKNK